MRKNKNSYLSFLTINKITSWTKKNKFILVLLTLVFFLRIPFLFEPLTNSLEAILIASAKNLLPSFQNLNIFDLTAIYFAKIAFFLFGNSFWALKFSTNLWLLINLFLFYIVARKYFNQNFLRTILILLTVLFCAPFLNFWPFSFLTLALLPILSLLTWVFIHLKTHPQSVYKALLLIVVGFFYFLSGTSYGKFNYYDNFFHYLENKVQKKLSAEETYYKNFGEDVFLGNTLSDYIKLKTASSDKIYFYGDLTSVYALSERKAASQYIKTNEALNHADDLFEDLKESKPILLLISQDKPKISQLDRLIKESYNRLYYVSPTSNSVSISLSTQTENVTIYKLKDLKTR